MGISVILIDKSEIVEKMLSHCLHYFSTKILRVENWDENKEKIKGIEPDILFVEWEIKEKGKALALSVAEEMTSTPVVVLYRSSSESELNTLPADQLPHRIIKPFEPQILRKQFTKLVPQMKDSKIHPFLKFPVPHEKEASPKETTKTPLSNQKTETNTLLQNHSEQKTTPTKSAGPSQPSIHSILKKAKEVTLTKTSDVTTQIKEKFSTSVQKEPPQKTETINKAQDILSPLKQKHTKIKEEEDLKEFNIDETTQNDLAPMAIKSSFSEKKRSSKSENIELNEKDILNILNKYKDTLEFQQLMEKALSEHITAAVTKTLQTDNLEGIMEKSLNTFKESKHFKSFVELEIKKYLKQQLPLTIKTVVTEEIKKITGD